MTYRKALFLLLAFGLAATVAVVGTQRSSALASATGRGLKEDWSDWGDKGSSEKEDWGDDWSNWSDKGGYYYEEDWSDWGDKGSSEKEDSEEDWSDWGDKGSSEKEDSDKDWSDWGDKESSEKEDSEEDWSDWSDKGSSEKEGSGKEDFDKDDWDKEDFEKEDSGTDFEKEDSDNDFEKEDSGKDFEKGDWDKEDFEKDDSGEDFEKKDSDKEDFEKDDSQEDDFEKEDSDKDFEKEDWDKEDFEKDDSDMQDSEKDDWNKGDFEKEDWDGEDFKEEDWDYMDSDKGGATPYVGGTGVWSRETLLHEGEERAYHVYVPAGGATAGVMVFLHGAGAGDDFPTGWEVRGFLLEQNADHFGWVGVIPEGTKDGVTKDGGSRGWNLLPTGVDEVGFVKAAVQSVAQAQQVPAGAPRVALGFSNGAGLALLLGCAFDKSTNLPVAHVAVEINDNADQQARCPFDRSTPKWSGVGEDDWFLQDAGRRGLLRDFAQSSADAGCGAEEVTTTVTGSSTCYGYASCPAAGELCVYDGLGHNIPATATSQAWSYLTGEDDGFWIEDGSEEDAAWEDSKEKEDSDEDFEKEDWDKEDFEKEDWDKEDFDKGDWDKEDFEKEDWDGEDFDKEDWDGEDFNKEDWDGEDFDKGDWNKGDFEKEDWDKEDFDKEEWDGSWDKGEDDSKETWDGGDYYSENILTLEHTWMGVTGQRSYAQELPPEGTHPTGLVVVIGGGCTRGSDDSLVDLAESRGVIVACPYARGSAGGKSVGEGWKPFLPEDSEDVDFVGGLIEHISSQYNVPHGNVIVTGFSFHGSMAYRVGCERSEVIGAVVPYGQAFLEIGSGHLPKGGDEGATQEETTNTMLDAMEAARQRSEMCDPTTPRPHFAQVGSQDEYYGEDGGVYNGRSLWERYSTTVLGCTGSPRPSSESATCSEYPSCAHLASPDLNQYCTVAGQRHSTEGWQAFVARAVDAIFRSSTTQVVQENSAEEKKPVESDELKATAGSEEEKDLEEEDSVKAPEEVAEQKADTEVTVKAALEFTNLNADAVRSIAPALKATIGDLAGVSADQVTILSITESTKRRLRALPRRLATTTVVDFEIVTTEEVTATEDAAAEAASVAASVAERVASLAEDTARVVTTLQEKVESLGLEEDLEAAGGDLQEVQAAMPSEPEVTHVVVRAPSTTTAAPFAAKQPITSAPVSSPSTLGEAPSTGVPQMVVIGASGAGVLLLLLVPGYGAVRRMKKAPATKNANVNVKPQVDLCGMPTQTVESSIQSTSPLADGTLESSCKSTSPLADSTMESSYKSVSPPIREPVASRVAPCVVGAKAAWGQ